MEINYKNMTGKSLDTRSSARLLEKPSTAISQLSQPPGVLALQGKDLLLALVQQYRENVNELLIGMDMDPNRTFREIKQAIEGLVTGRYLISILEEQLSKQQPIDIRDLLEMVNKTIQAREKSYNFPYKLISILPPTSNTVRIGATNSNHFCITDEKTGYQLVFDSGGDVSEDGELSRNMEEFLYAGQYGAPFFTRIIGVARGINQSFDDVFHKGLRNTNHFNAFADKHQETIEELPFYVLLLDLDAFKEINDHLGHAAGDDVLRVFGGVLHSIIRLKTGDTIWRIGGDEFCVCIDAKDTLLDINTKVEEINNKLQSINTLLQTKPIEGMDMRQFFSEQLEDMQIGSIDIDAFMRLYDIWQKSDKKLNIGTTIGISMVDPTKTLRQLKEEADKHLNAQKADKPIGRFFRYLNGAMGLLEEKGEILIENSNIQQKLKKFILDTLGKLLRRGIITKNDISRVINNTEETPPQS